ncbi:MAG: ROK family protein [Erysipelotrichaceae bacterium]|nr:ROK family protein [Erysipelotrichaceae bacterium]
MARIADLKNENIKTVRKCFYSGGILSMNRIRRETGLSHGSIINVIRLLEERGEIFLAEKSGSAVGRKTHHYVLNPAYRHFLAVDVKRTEQGFLSRTFRMDLSGEISDTYEKAFAEMDDTYLHEELTAMMNRYPDTDMILISTPGVCANGIITNGEIFSMDIASWIEENFHVPYVIENDVNVAAIGFCNEDPDRKNITVVYQASKTIFGCGVIINGRLYNGFSHAAGEVRYLPFMEEHKDTFSSRELLKEMILCVAAILNPEIIAWNSDTVQEELDFSDASLPQRHTPAMIHIKDLHSYCMKGLYFIGMYNMLEHYGGNEQ